MRTVIYPVRDLERAKERFTALLGVTPYMDTPHYVGFSIGGQDIGLDPNGHEHGMTGPVGYWHVDDVGSALRALVDAGSEEVHPVRDVGGGKLVASVTDPDGNVLGLIQSG
nr:VOC family protein [Streptomyces sp. HNM0574]